MPNAVADIVERFALEPHPEGGFFREVHRSRLVIDHPALDASVQRRRSSGTFIYFLLAEGDFSAFHRVLASDEIWHLYAGGPLELHTIDADQRYAKRVLTTDLARGEPALVIPAGWWQAARPARVEMPDLIAPSSTMTHSESLIVRRIDPPGLHVTTRVGAM